MTPRRRRALWLLGGMVLLGLGVALVLRAFEQNLIFFYTPTMVQEQKPDLSRPLRIGGLVEEGSVKHYRGDIIRFTVTDLKHSLRVRYQGALPSLFREGQGVVAQGMLDARGVMRATSILAKHDENYMPPEVVDALKQSGRWEHYKNGGGMRMNQDNQ